MTLITNPELWDKYMAFKLGTSLGGRKMDSLFLVDEIFVFLAVSIIHVIALIADTLPWWASVVP